MTQPKISVDQLSISTGAETAAYQTVSFTVAKVAGDSTGLANDATVYTATITVDGSPILITVTGSAAQLFSTLLTQINTDLGVFAVAAIVDGNVVVSSATTGSDSSVSILDTGGFPLFFSLTDFDAIEEAVASKTGAFPVPSGPTAERPLVPSSGMFRHNTFIDRNEQYTNGNWYRVPAPLTGVASLDFANLAADGGQDTLTITVTGAEVGDYVFVTTSAAPATGVLYQAWVSALNTVSVRATNATNGATNPAAQDFLVLVFKQ